MFYVYEWFVKETNEIFYVGKGCKNRYKEKTRRNKYFKSYLENFNCESRIIKQFDSEKEAFKYENKKIVELKKLNQAKCNLDNGGIGGCNFVWTKEMKEYHSIYNPMKSTKQRKRMSKNNPMKNPLTVKKVVSKKVKPVVLNNVCYSSIKEATEKLGHASNIISKWCKQGYDYNGNPCRYANEAQKQIPSIKRTHPKVKNYKPVIIDGVKYETLQDGAKAIGVWSENLIKAIKGKRKCKGHTCEYANQHPS